MKLLQAIALAALAAFAVDARARVHTVTPQQDFLVPFHEGDFPFQPGNVGIDGDSIITLVDREGGRSALLYRRGADGTWSLSRTLLEVSGAPGALGDDLAMAGGVAALRIDDVLHVYERNSANEWAESATAGTPRTAPGLAISNRRILAGRRDCNHDADVFEKSLGSGVWRITSHIAGQAGQCSQFGAQLDLDGDVALVRNPNEIREYRRNGTAVDWQQVGTMAPPAGVLFGTGPLTLRGNLAIASGGAYFRRAAAGWNFAGQIQPLDYANFTIPNSPNYRDGVVLTHSVYGEFHADQYVYVYRENAAGAFDHAAVLQTPGYTFHSDVSGNTVVASSLDFGGDVHYSMFTLPEPLTTPAAIANDFETRDVSGWQQTPGSQFALANTGLGVVYRQSSLVAESHAVLTDSDWSYAQSIEADITPTAVDGNDRWYGLGVRYVDAANHYYVTLRGSNKIQLKKMVNGVFTTLGESAFTYALNTPHHVQLTATGARLEVRVDGRLVINGSDSALTHGRAALMTYRTRADFDNVYAGPTTPFNLALKDYQFFGLDWGRQFTIDGGDWTYVEGAGSEILGFGQTTTTGDARAIVGAPTDDQLIAARIRLDSYGNSPSGAWYGLFARYVDSRNHYYLSIRSTNQLQIRKQVNGVVTVLESVPFSAAPGAFHDFRFVVVGNELHAYVDGTFVGGAIDNDIAKGQYGLGNYRASATYGSFIVTQ